MIKRKKKQQKDGGDSGRCETMEELLQKHIAIIRYMANKYRYLDEYDDLISWGYIGFMNAINEQKEKLELELAPLIFKHIKLVYIKEYFNKQQEMSERNVSTSEKMVGKDGIEGDELLDSFEGESFHYTEQDIKQMLIESLFEESDLSRDLIIDFFLGGMSTEELQMEYNIKPNQISKIIRKGSSLIKRYLINNDLINEWAMDPRESIIKKIEPIKALTAEQCRQLKYIRKTYPLLNRYDLANVLDCDIRSINYTLDYPTTTYIRYGLDESINDVAINYIKKHYPYMLPSEVEIA